MKTSKEVLTSILKTTQMGQIGIRSVLKSKLDTCLRSELRTQLEEYDAIEKEAYGIAASKGWRLSELNPGIKAMTNIMTIPRLSFGNINSKAAAMVINGNTRGIIKGHKNINQYAVSDQRIQALAEKLINFEEINNKHLQGFL